MELGKFDVELVNRLKENFKWLDSGQHNGYSYTVLFKGKPLLCFGLSFLWPGVATSWLIPHKNMINKHKVIFHKGALNYFKTAAKVYKLHRIDATVHSLNVQGVKWIKSMYFEFEGLLRHYGYDKADYKLYSRIYK